MGVRKELEETFDFEIIDEFLDHFEMAVENIEPLTVGLEHEEFYEKNIGELFRIFHNIKSATGFLQLTPIYKFAIEVEGLLETLRAQTGPAPAHIIDWLIACDDHMSVWNINLRMDESLAPLPDTLKTIPTLEH